jgi:hypothetical protein
MVFRLEEVSKICRHIIFSNISLAKIDRATRILKFQIMIKYTKYTHLLKYRRQFFHGSLEAIVGRTKLSKKTKIGDGSGMVPGVPNKFQYAETPFP